MISLTSFIFFCESLILNITLLHHRNSNSISLKGTLFSEESILDLYLTLLTYMSHIVSIPKDIHISELILLSLISIL